MPGKVAFGSDPTTKSVPGPPGAPLPCPLSLLSLWPFPGPLVRTLNPCGLLASDPSGLPPGAAMTDPATIAPLPEGPTSPLSRAPWDSARRP